MLNKPLNALTLLIVVIWAALCYTLIAGLVNFKLLHDLLSGPEPLSLETMSAALGRVDAGLAPWLASMFASCLIGATCFSGATYDGPTMWPSDDDEQLTIGHYAWSSSSYDDFRINPASGLPMVGCVDVSGNAYGFCE